MPSVWLRHAFTAVGSFARLGRSLSSTPAATLDGSLPVVAIVGRPNVGKSALFNRLVKRRDALVYNTPHSHVTRDYKVGLAMLGDLKFSVVDTSGFEPEMTTETIQARATLMTAHLMEKVDIALFLLDCRQGLTPVDEGVTAWLRKRCSYLHVILVANKAEGISGSQRSQIQSTMAESLKLGFGEPVGISAETGEGMTDLYAAIQPHIDLFMRSKEEAEEKESPTTVEATANENPAESTTEEAKGLNETIDSLKETVNSADLIDEVVQVGKKPVPRETKTVEDRNLKIAIMGVPNVGKSTLMNRLLGRERSIIGPEPGLTRDAVRDSFTFQDFSVEIVDTAGWMRRTRMSDVDESGGKLAFVSQHKAKDSMNFCHVVVLVVDVAAAMENSLIMLRRELSLAGEILEEGRNLVVVLNKIDAVPPDARKRIQDEFPSKVSKILHEMDGLPCWCISAKTGEGLEKLMPSVVELYRKWNKRVSTPNLNRWMRELDLQTSVKGMASGGSDRVKFVAQSKIRPPTFKLQVSGSKGLTKTQHRTLIRSLRKNFDFAGVPVRLLVVNKKWKEAGSTSPRFPLQPRMAAKSR
ncbi:hypothetical protein BSKO_00895 [Bryopsis sp. KO-2023]|nr:hypothetical protein BSKO_00895 [Bryopsis sp. KO-2023]